MQPVRRHIIEILKERGSATVAELAAELAMAQVSVRHHLDVLVGEDLVELTGVRRHDGAGRPSQVYALTPQAAALFPQRNDVLANNLLSELRATLPGGQYRDLLARLAERTAREAPSSAEPPDPSPSSAEPESQLRRAAQRLDEVSAFLTDRGYAARWEQADGRFKLHACNCPYTGVADQHPELCAMDHVMMQRLLPGVVRIESQVLDGATRCTYVLAAPGSATAAEPSSAEPSAAAPPVSEVSG